MYKLIRRFLNNELNTCNTYYRNYCVVSKINNEKNKSIVEEEKINKAMKIYLERARKNDEFIDNQKTKYAIGKRHLANMMGEDPEFFSEEQVNEAIRYLFPSGIFERNARPVMKPPAEVFPITKSAAFDINGKPFHHLFYTGKPNYYSLLNEIVSHLNDLNRIEDRMIKQGITVSNEPKIEILGSQWIKQENLEKKIIENLKPLEYGQWITAMERLLSHPYANRVKDFITKYRISHSNTSDKKILKIQTDDMGREYVEIKGGRKTAHAKVLLFKPGTGKITINGQNINYLKTKYAKEAVIFPLILSGYLNKVDVEAHVENGGPSGQAGAIRYALSHALTAFLSLEKIEELRVAGLLQRDVRRKERKKPGQEGARRKFTWKKR